MSYTCQLSIKHSFPFPQQLVQNIKLAETILGIGSENVRLPRKPLSGKERENVLEIINTGIKNRPDLSKYSF